MRASAKTVALYLCAVGLLMATLTSCSSQEGFSFSGEPQFTSPEYVRDPPAVQLSYYSGLTQESKEEDGNSAIIDLTNLSKGYVTTKCENAARLKLRVERATGGEETEKMDFDLSGAGEYEVFPLTMGNGHYKFSVYVNLSGNEYMSFLSAEADVTLETEFAPFLVPNKIVNYDANSSVVTFSWELAQHATSDLEVVQQVYYWIEHNITYDTNKANRVRNSSGYVPDVDQTLAEKTGICYDYAALVASMLRANGIPCQLIIGDVSMEDGSTVYHAWNMIWLDEVGWISVKIPTTPKEWERIDLTFAASQDPEIAEFIGNGQNYSGMFVY